jgi:hypothetical protein
MIDQVMPAIRCCRSLRRQFTASGAGEKPAARILGRNDKDAAGRDPLSPHFPLRSQTNFMIAGALGVLSQLSLKGIEELKR